MRGGELKLGLGSELGKRGGRKKGARWLRVC
jgi:hypothetical protein